MLTNLRNLFTYQTLFHSSHNKCFIQPQTQQARAAITALVRVSIAERKEFLPNPKSESHENLSWRGDYHAVLSARLVMTNSGLSWREALCLAAIC